MSTGESSAMTELVLCCGMIRSASTLQYQIVAELVERHVVGERIGFADQQTVSSVLRDAEKVRGFAVIKVHEVMAELDSRMQLGPTRCFYTFRDLRAVALSVMRKWGVPFAQVIGRNGWLETAVRSSLRWLAVPGVCISRYENMLQIMPAEIMKWSGGLDLQISDHEARQLADEFSIVKQKERIDKVHADKLSDTSSFIDTRSLLHHDHIIDGSVDSWKTELEAWQIRQIERRFGEWQSRHGYEPTA